MSSNPNDKVYTPSHIVDDVLTWCLPKVRKGSKILEPFMGEGAFYNEIVSRHEGPVEGCEIDMDLDFFDYEKSTEWIITNPPYSTFSQCLTKCLSVAENVVLLIPVNKLLSSMPRLMDVKTSGFGICEIYYLGSGRQAGFPFGFPVAAVWLQKNYNEGWYREIYHARCYQSKPRSIRNA